MMSDILMLLTRGWSDEARKLSECERRDSWKQEWLERESERRRARLCCYTVFREIKPGERDRRNSLEWCDLTWSRGNYVTV